MSGGREFVSLVREEHLAIVTIERPPVNALNKQVLGELQDIFNELAEDKSISAAIITGSGKKAFVAGADIGDMPSLTVETGKQLDQLYQQTFNVIEDYPKPVICALNGLAFGGGVELALACDLRIAAASAIFCLSEVNLGLIPAGGGTVRLSRTIPVGLAKEMIYTAKRVSAQEALRIGLVNRVVPDEEVLAAAREMGNLIAQKGTLAVEAVKKSINKGIDLDRDQALELEAELGSHLFATEDFREGIGSFQEKRKPQFTGR